MTHGNLTSFEWVVLGRPREGGGDGRHSFPLGWPLSTRWCHSAHCKRVNDHCSKHVPGHLISRFGDVPWPPRSPDLSKCDFFLWRYLKSRVYTHKPRTLNDLKEAIRQEIRPIDRQLLARVMDDSKKKGLKTASKKRVVILPISFLKLNHLVWHVLSFNFV